MTTSLESGPVSIVAPATSANLGPGYDAFGLALDYADRITAEVTDGGVTVEVGGVGADELPRDETHLVASSMLAAFELMGLRPPGLRLYCTNRIPHARGMGSSSAAIVGGIVAARELVVGGEDLLSERQMLALATSIEGHPDNVAATLLGGLTVAWSEVDVVDAARFDVSASVVAFVPPTPVATDEARELLPAEVPHGDAARNAGRAGLLVSALSGRPELLLPATYDELHQAYRSPAMPESYELMTELRGTDVPATISGAGPTVLAFARDTHEAQQLLGNCPPDWDGYAMQVSNRGAHRV